MTPVLPSNMTARRVKTPLAVLSDGAYLATMRYGIFATYHVGTRVALAMSTLAHGEETPCR